MGMRRNREALMAAATTVILTSFVYTAAAFKELALPRIPLYNLDNPEFRVYKDGQLPYILTHVANNWGIFDELSPQWLASNFQDGITDVYTNGMRRLDGDEGQSPNLDYLDEALVLQHAVNNTRHQTYVQWRIRLPQWERMAHLFDPFPPYLSGKWWQDKCLHNRTTKANLWSAVAWRMMVIGKDEAGMFVHPDSFFTSVWQMQVQGTKRWAVCHPEDDHLFPRAGEWDPFNPSFDDWAAEYPKMREARCGFADVSPGEVLLYPSNYWHATLNLDYPCIGIAGRTVTALNYKGIFEHLRNECNSPRPDASEHYFGASENLYSDMCDTVLPRCLAVWEGAYGSGRMDVAAEVGHAQHQDPLCRVAPADRLDCSETSQHACSAVGCCWSPTPDVCRGAGCPICFAPGA
jgi:hypothetical protein